MTQITIHAYVERRAKALATVFLTSRRDIQLFEVGDDFGLDFLVRIRSEPDLERQERLFGVILNGTAGPLSTSSSATDHLKHRTSPGNPHPFSFPVIELIFSMEGDKGYFAWRSEPVVSETGAPKLVLHKTATCQPADRKALDEIVERVGLWYEKLDSLLLVKS
jgi:hypothetical protein